MAQFGSSLIIVNRSWTDLKTIAAAKNLVLQYDATPVGYHVFGVDGPVVYVCEIASGTLPSTITDANPTAQQQASSDLADFQVNWMAQLNQPIILRTPDGRERRISEKPVAQRQNYYSFDWTDATTWFQAAGYYTAEVPSNPSGDLLAYQLAHAPIIDNYHGKITLEDQIVDSSGHSYRVKVTLNGAPLVEQDPHFGAGGDYVVDYQRGVIKFLTARQPADAIQVTYHAVDLSKGDGSASMFIISPPAEKKLTLNLVEVQYAADLIMTDSVVLKARGIADYFLTPAQMAAMGIPAGAGIKIPLMTFVYKSLSDFQTDAMRAYPRYLAVGNGGVAGAPYNWRGQPVDIFVFDWDYVASTTLHSSSGMDLQLYLQHDQAFEGWMATGTFYGLLENE